MKLTKEQEEIDETIMKTEKQMIIITYALMIVWLATAIMMVIMRT